VRKLHLPVVGIGLALCLFVGAALSYPGGTTESPDTVGYSLIHNFISSLFASRALNGAANPARYIAMAAMVFLCISIGFAFQQISTTVVSRVHRKTIEIAGIGSVVYSLLIVTPMHDLMVTIGLAFNFVALLATTHWLFLQRRWRLAAWGALCIALTALGAVMYYRHVGYALLPVVQKLGLVTSVGWVIAVYYAQLGSSQAENTLTTTSSIQPVG
jgi:hypothetical protein